MKLLKKVEVFFILTILLILVISSCTIVTAATNETIQNDIYYVLTFDANTSDPVENLPESIKADVGETIIIPSQSPIRVGYTFSGWNTMSDGSGALYGPGDTFTDFYQDTVLYAQWIKNQNTINFDQNTTDNVDNLPENISYLPGDIITIPEQIPIRDGYTFSSWNTLEDGLGTSYEPGSSLTGPENNLTLYAQWEENNPPNMIWVIILIPFFLIFLCTTVFLLYNSVCNCK